MASQDGVSIAICSVTHLYVKCRVGESELRRINIIFLQTECFFLIGKVINRFRIFRGVYHLCQGKNGRMEE